MALDLAKLPPGTVLMDKFRVEGTLGVGGMGVVLAAQHLGLGHRVALKVLLPALAGNASVVKRFTLEAKAATRIHSRHVARVLDVGILTAPRLPPRGVPYMVMEYLEGKDLAAYVRMGKRFAVDEALGFVLQAAEALAQAHRQGVIHRDIKPANLFVDERGGRRTLKVLDFGISKILDEEPEEMQLTKTTTVLGSGLYMSPEQMRSSRGVDFRTDIYSLGVCLYELLTGTQPYTAASFSELVVKVNVEPPTPIRKYRPDIPEDLADTIAKAYARDPDERYHSVQAMVAALEPFVEGQSVEVSHEIQAISRHPSMPPPPPTPAADPPEMGRTGAAVSHTRHSDPPPKRSSSFGMVLGAALGALLIVGGTGFLLARRSKVFSGAATGAPAPVPTPSVSSSVPARGGGGGGATPAPTAEPAR